MEWETLLAFGLLIVTLVSFLMEKVSVDTTALTLLGIILIFSGLEISENWPSVNKILAVFSNEAPLTIAAMFVISASLNRCRLIEQTSDYLGKFCKYGYRRFMLILLVLVAFVSAFVNNTPVVVVLLPVVISLSRIMGVSSSKMLIPVSYASIFGGCCTLVGTSTNILASGIITNSSTYQNMQPIGMFELSKIGLPLLVISLGVLVLFGRKLLPNREALSDIISDLDSKEFLTEAIVQPNSPLHGQKIKDSGISKLSGVRLLEIVRDGASISARKTEEKLKTNDRLVLSCKPQGIIETSEFKGINLINQTDLGIEQVSSKTGIMVECVVGPSSSLISKSILDASFRARFNLTILAVHRRGKNLGLDVDKVRLQASDTLLILGSKNAIERLRKSEEVILLDQATMPMKNMKRKAPIVIGVLVGIIGIASLGILPISITAILGVSVLLLTGCLKAREAYRAIEWNILILIYGMLALGVTMQETGASSIIASVVGGVGLGLFEPEWQPLAVLIVLYLCTAFLTEVLSNNATIVIMAPIALEVAKLMEMTETSARAYVLTACIAASASFVTPIGYQTNTFVYTVGGYKFGDFVKVGIYFNAIYFMGTILLVSCFWGFIPFKF
jgi:di/tricarboxylate transporter